MAKYRLFLDMDGTLFEYRNFVEETQYGQKDYFASLEPIYKNLIEAVKIIIKNEPDIEVFALSAYSKEYKNIPAEKDASLDAIIPELDKAHRIYTYVGENKQKFIGGARDNDFILDDYSHNLFGFEQQYVQKDDEGNIVLTSEGGHGIKFHNGMNATEGSWTGPMIAYTESPESIAKALTQIIKNRENIRQETSEYMLRNETQGLTMFISKESLETIYDELFKNYINETTLQPMYADIHDFRKNITQEHWETLKVLRSKYKDIHVKNHINKRTFEFESKTFLSKFNNNLKSIETSTINHCKDSTVRLVKMEFLLKQISLKKIDSTELREITTTLNVLKKQQEEELLLWKEDFRKKISTMQIDADSFLKKYEMLCSKEDKEFVNKYLTIKNNINKNIKEYIDIVTNKMNENKDAFEKVANALEQRIDDKLFKGKGKHQLRDVSVAEDVFNDTSLKTNTRSSHNADIEEIL